MKQPLASHIGWVDIHDIKLRVKDFWSNLGLKFDSLYTPIPSSMKENIDIIIPYFDGGEIGQHNNKLYKRCSNVVHTWRSIHIVLGHLPESNDHVSTKVYEMVRRKNFYCGGDSSTNSILVWDIHSAYGLMPPHNEIGKEVGWVKPNYGWVALNVNGSVMEANQAAGVGALCQDHPILLWPLWTLSLNNRHFLNKGDAPPDSNIVVADTRPTRFNRRPTYVTDYA
ncbi:hypothetical protein JHK85_010806 [Glycine max]|nr:hypothetical protein JHK85_010806 [Glycine max]KAG5066785.1 hypothetical protein JHK86_010516 [Glycine max]